VLVIEDHCCDCASPGYPCLGIICRLRHVPVHYCDECGKKLREIYGTDGEELCLKCYIKIYGEDNEEKDDGC
jgi:hypothetical protein